MRRCCDFRAAILAACVFMLSAAISFAQDADRQNIFTVGSKNVTNGGLLLKYERAVGNFLGLTFSAYATDDPLSRTTEFGGEFAGRFYLSKTKENLEGFYLGVPVAYDNIGIFGDRSENKKNISGVVTGVNIGYQWMFFDRRVVLDINAGGRIGFYGDNIRFMFTDIPGDNLYLRTALSDTIILSPYFALSLGFAF